MSTMESGKNFVTNILSPAGDGEDEHTLTKTQDKVEIVKEDSPAENAASLESLMQEQDADMTAVTEDEDAHNHPPQHHPTPTIHTQEQLPLPHHHLVPKSTQLTPLQLVYLQPTPHGVNIIPIQAAGQPSFTPYSPAGFPAHPHHPVVVQPGLPFPLQYPTFHPSHPVYTPGPYPANQQYPHTPTFPQYFQGQVPHHLVGIPQPTSTPPFRQQFFRPWEDGSHTSDHQSVLCPHTDCGGEGGQHSQLQSGEGGQGQHSQSGGEDQQLPPYSEEDFPALTKELSKIKIKK